jgi:hypothetical protein
MSGCGALAAAETEHRRLAAATAAARCTLAEVEAIAQRALAAVAAAELVEAAALAVLKPWMPDRSTCWPFKLCLMTKIVSKTQFINYIKSVAYLARAARSDK